MVGETLEAKQSVPLIELHSHYINSLKLNLTQFSLSHQKTFSFLSLHIYCSVVCVDVIVPGENTKVDNKAINS
jgi:hypothetical protein